MTETKINSVIIYGPTGVGKTITVAKAFPKALWIVTQPTNLSGYHSWLEKCPEEAAQLGLGPIPESHIVQVGDVCINPNTFEVSAVNTQAVISQHVRNYCLSVAKGEDKFDGIVFDEFSVFVHRVYHALQKKSSNTFKAIDDIKSWVREICALSSIANRRVCFVCHAQNPKYDESGKLQYMGGPAMPIGTMVAEVCALPDAVLQMESKTDPIGNVSRVFRTQVHPEWIRKIRRWGIPVEVEADLRKLLA